MNFSTVFHATQAAFELQSKVLVVSRVIVVELLKFLASASYRERRERDAHIHRGRERESERQRGRAGWCWRAREILRLLIWIANGRNDSLPPDEAFPRNAAGSWQFPPCLPVRVCVPLRAPLLPPPYLVIRRSPRKRSSFRKVFLNGAGFSLPGI